MKPLTTNTNNVTVLFSHMKKYLQVLALLNLILYILFFIKLLEFITLMQH